MKKYLIILIMIVSSFMSMGQPDTFTLIGKSAPTAYLNGYYNICQGQQATIPVYLTNGPTWDVTFTDGYTQWTVVGITTSTYDLIVSPPNVRTYQILNVSSNGCEGTFSGAATVVIYDEPTVFNLSCATTNFCPGLSSAPLILSGAEPGEIYHLTRDGNPVVGTTIVATSTTMQWPGQTQPGLYQAVAENAAGCQSTMTGNVVLTTNPLPDPALGITTVTTTYCEDAIATFSTANIPNATSYMWDLPIGTDYISGQSTSSITVRFGANSGNVTVIGYNTCGGGLQATIPIIVNPAPTLTATASPSAICANGSSILTANGTGTAFTWNVPSNNTQSITVMPLSTITYTVTATNSFGCSATDDVTVTVNPNPNVTLNLTQSTYCTDVNSAILTGGLPVGGTYSGTVVFANNTVYPAMTGSSTTTVTYTYTDPTTSCPGTATDVLTINPIPDVTFIGVVGTINTDTPPYDMMQNVIPIGGTFTGNGMIGSIFNPAIAGAGTHIITYTYVDPLTGCSDVEQKSFTVSGGPNGIDDVATDAISIFPNPTASDLNITGINTQKFVALQIFDYIGKEVYTSEINTESMSVNVNNLRSGTYLIRFIDADGLSVAKRFVKF